MAKFTTFANDLLDAIFDTGASGTLALGPVSSRVNYTLPFKIRLTTTVSTNSAAGTAVSGGSYADQSIAGAMGAAASGSKSSSGALTYSSMPACTVADVMQVDSTGSPKNMNFRGGSSLAKVVNAGDTFLIPAASLTATEA